MLCAKAHPAAIARTDHQRTSQLAIRHVAHLRHFVGDIVETDGQEISEHDFSDRSQARHRGPHGSAKDGLLGDGRISHTERPELLVQPDRCLEHAASLADILAEEDDAVIAFHFLRDAARYGVTICQFRHAQPPSA